MRGESWRLLTRDRPDVGGGARELGRRDDLVWLRSWWCYAGVQREFGPKPAGNSSGHDGGVGERMVVLWLWGVVLSVERKWELLERPVRSI